MCHIVSAPCCKNTETFQRRLYIQVHATFTGDAKELNIVENTGIVFFV